MSVKAVRVVEMTKVVRIAPGEVGDSSGTSSGSPQGKKRSSVVANKALESLAHSPTRPSTSSSNSSESPQKPKHVWQPRKSVTLGGLSVSTRSLCDQPSWIDEHMGEWEKGGLGWKVAAAAGRFFYGLAEIAIVRPIGFCLAAVAATACLVAAVAMGIIGAITYCCFPKNLVRAKALLKLSKLYAEAASRVTGNPIGLVGRTALFGLSLLGALATLPGACFYGLEPTKKCLRYAGYNLVCAKRNMGEIAGGALSDVPCYFFSRLCGECCYKSLKSWYWSNVAESLPKPNPEKSKAQQIVNSHRQCGFYKFIRSVTGGDSLARNIVHRHD